MNAEMPPALRSESVQAQIHKVRKFSRYARKGCAVLRVLLIIVAVMFLANFLLPSMSKDMKVDFGVYYVTGDNITSAGLRAWSLLVAGIPIGLTITLVFLLHRLFSNLAAGDIYTPGNVHQIRRIGLLALWMAIHATAVPALSLALLQAGLIDKTLVTLIWMKKEPILNSLTLDGWFASWWSAGLILLASWIMDVGRHTSDEAERLRGEAELVV